MEKTTTNRKELFHVLAEVTKELRKKIALSNFSDNYNQPERIIIGTADQTIKWIKNKPRNDEEEKPILKAEESEEPSHGFGYDICQGLLLGTSWIRVRDQNHNRTDKMIPIVVVGSKAENESIILRTSLRWYDHFRPSVIRMKGLIEYARRMRVKRKAIAIEHHLAKIVPDRIDSILLEGEKDEKQPNVN